MGGVTIQSSINTEKKMNELEFISVLILFGLMVIFIAWRRPFQENMKTMNPNYDRHSKHDRKEVLPLEEE